MTRSLAKEIIKKLIKPLDKVYRAQRYRYAARVEDLLDEVLRLSIEAPRAKTKTKCGALVDTIDRLHDWLEVGASQGMIRSGLVGELMKPRTHDHQGGYLWQLSMISRAMLKSTKKKG